MTRAGIGRGKMAKWSRDEAKVLNGRERGDFGRKGGKGRRKRGAGRVRLAGWVWEVLMGLTMDRTAHGARSTPERRVAWPVWSGRGRTVFCRGSWGLPLLRGCLPSVEVVVWWWSIREGGGWREGDGRGPACATRTPTGTAALAVSHFVASFQTEYSSELPTWFGRLSTGFLAVRLIVLDFFRSVRLAFVC